MNIIGITGPPAAGKSALVRAILPSLGAAEGGRFGLLHWMHYPEANVIVLGSYDGDARHPGTDAYDRATCAAAADYVRLLFRDGHRWLPPGVTVLWEGVLLAEPAIVEPMAAHEHRLIVLDAPDVALDHRYAHRGQARPSWLPQFAAKLDALERVARWERWPNGDLDDFARNAARLHQLVIGSTPLQSLGRDVHRTMGAAA